MMPTHVDAIIVGAGPAGSTAAILLARAGWSVALVEKQRFPRRKVCGECIAASNLPLLDALGVASAFADRAGPALRRVALMQGPTTLVADLPAADDPQHAWGRALGRETLDSLLLDQARRAGARVLQPWSVQSLMGEAGDQRCTLRDTESGLCRVLHAPVAILAHGSWEPLPDARAQQRLHRRGSDLFAFKANFRGASLAPGLLPVLCFAGGYGGMVVADQGLTTLACCIRADRLQALRRAAPGQAAGDVVEAMLRRECHGVGQALRAARRDGAWLASGPIAPGVRLRCGEPAFRIGNATGEAHPIIGEGISMAMQSAWLLCAHLLSADHKRGDAAAAAWHAEVQRRYAADWRRHFNGRLRLASVFAHLAMRPSLSTSLVSMLGRWPGLLTWGARWGGKVRCAPDPATIAWLASGTAAQRPAT